MTKNKSIVKMIKQGNLKKNKNNKIKIDKSQDEVTKAIVIFAIVIVVLGLTYFVSGLVTGEIKFGNSIKKAAIQYDNILIGTSFTQNSKEYYVLMYDFKNDSNGSAYKSYISTYGKKDNSLKVYYADLGVSLNKTYINDNINYNPTKASEIRINDTTLIKINNGQLSLFITGKDNVLNYLSELK